MNPCTRTSGNESAVALPMALFALVILSRLLLAFLTLAAMEPFIARNHDASARALYIAAEGVELASSQLASSSWQPAFSTLSLPGLINLIKEYSTAIDIPDAKVSDWSTTPPSPGPHAHSPEAQ